MKTEYSKPQVEIIEFEIEGVIASSGDDLPSDGPTGPGMGSRGIDWDRNK